jgi:hypothetical protein
LLSASSWALPPQGGPDQAIFRLQLIVPCPLNYCTLPDEAFFFGRPIHLQRAIWLLKRSWLSALGKIRLRQRWAMAEEIEQRSVSDLTFKYRWGTERPVDRAKRLAKAREAVRAERIRIEEDYRKPLARNIRDAEVIEAQILEVEILAPGGRYDRQLEEKLRVLIRHLGPDGELPEPALRMRGRPKKPPEAKRRRRSRAK